MAPDFRGHGRSFHRGPYAAAIHAADVADLLEQDTETVVLGHSMGGLVAMVLGTGWFGLRVRQVIALGTKLEWKPEEMARLRERGQNGVRWFENRSEALDFYLRLSGLQGLVAPESAEAESGIVQEGSRFRLAMDPAAARPSTGALPEKIFAAMRAPLRMIAGENDPLVTAEQMKRYDPEPILLPGLSHNAQVQAPEILWQAVEPILRVSK
jgi:pimeloyl-ACP methyl ester carboxylesterase